MREQHQRRTGQKRVARPAIAVVMDMRKGHVLDSAARPPPLSAVGGSLCQIRFHRIRRSTTVSLIA